MPTNTDSLKNRFSNVTFDRRQDRVVDIDSIYGEKELLAETLEILKENNKDTLAQVFTDNRYTRKDNQVFSGKFLQTLINQGFMNNGDI